MKFTEKVQRQFELAGWKKNRNVKEKYENAKILKFDEFPQFLKNFLYEYGDLTIDVLKPFDSKVKSKINLGVEYAGYDDMGDYEDDIKTIGGMLFPFAFHNTDTPMIACDKDGKIYMLGDYTYRISDTFQEGIETLITYNWSNGFYQLDEDTGEWVKNKRWND